MAPAKPTMLPLLYLVAALVKVKLELVVTELCQADILRALVTCNRVL